MTYTLLLQERTRGRPLMFGTGPALNLFDATGNA